MNNSMNKRPWLWQGLLYVWVSPVTLPCLPLAVVARVSGGGYVWREGVLEVWGGLVGRWLASGVPLLGAVNAITLGHLVAGVSPAHLDSTRVHERTHVQQFERWGFLFPLVYTAGGLVSRWRGGSFYWDNPYEIEARVRAECHRTTSSQPE